jgi:hypothetical protein
MGYRSASTPGRWPLSGLGGILFGLAALTRPIGLLLLPLLALIPLARPPLRMTWRHALAVSLGFALVVGVWMGRNAILFGRFALTTIGDLNLYYYNAANLEAHRLGVSLGEARAMLDGEIQRRGGGDPRWPSDPYGALAREIIWEHPLLFAWVNGVDALNGFRPGFSFMLSLFGEGSGARAPIPAFMHGDLRAVLAAMQGQAGLILALEGYMLLFIGALILCGLVGAVALLARRAWSETVLLVLIPALLLYLPGIASNARFRAPVEPLLALLAATGFYAALTVLRRPSLRVRK